MFDENITKEIERLKLSCPELILKDDNIDMCMFDIKVKDDWIHFPFVKYIINNSYKTNRLQLMAYIAWMIQLKLSFNFEVNLLDINKKALELTKEQFPGISIEFDEMAP